MNSLGLAQQMIGSGAPGRASTLEPRLNAALAADMRALAAARAPDQGGHSNASPATACERDGGGVGVDTSDTQSEMMFLLLHALKSTPCQEAAKKLEEEANRLGIFGSATDWNGVDRPRTYEDVCQLHTKVRPSHLHRLALAGAGICSEQKQRGAALQLPATLLRKPVNQIPDSHQGSSSLPAAVLVDKRVPLRGVTNEILSLRARELGMGRNRKWRPHFYKRIEYQASIMGHFCAVYCLIFDKTGMRYVTGSDDKLIKIWNSRSGILLRTLRGHVSDIVDLAISCDNRFLASCSNDHDVRIWWLHNGVPLAVLPGHTNVINNVTWSPSLNADLSQQLYSWSDDGTLRIWRVDSVGTYTGCHMITASDNAPSAGPSAAAAVRNGSPSEINCAVFDPIGRWVALGCADNLIRVYWLNALNARPTRLSGHAGQVEHIMTNNKGDLLVSGSGDGSVRLWPLLGLSWPLQVDYQRARVLNIRAGEQASTIRNAEKHKLNVVLMTQDNKRIVTAQNLEKQKRQGDWLVRVKVWDVDTGELVHNFNNHHDRPVHVLTRHPHEMNVVASAGYDSKVFFWDVVRGECVASFQIAFRLDDRLNPVSFDQNSAEILEGRWHPDGMCFMTVHKNGFTSIMSVSNHADSFKKTPREQFFQVDFGELIMDQQRNVIDRAAQVPPHTMASGALCDRFGQQLDIGLLSGQDVLPSHPLLVSPPRRPANTHHDVLDADEIMAAEMQEDEFDDSDDDDDEDFMEEEEEDDETYNKRRERKQKRQQTERERRAAAWSERRCSKRPSRSGRGDDDDDEVSGYSEEDLSDSELFVVSSKTRAKGPRREDRTGWQPEQQRRRALTQAELDKNVARSRDWLLVTTPPKNVDHGYVPQIGDVVVYFRQGHEEQLCDYPEAQCQRAQQPWEEFRLRSAEKCEIADIKYQIPATNENPDNSVYCLLHLKRLPDNLQAPKAGRMFATGQPIKARWKGGHRFPGTVVECNDDGTYVVQFDDGDREPAEAEEMMQPQTFIVSHRRTELPEFVLPLYRYERHERNVYGPGDRFHMLYEDNPVPFQGTVMGMRPFHPRDFPDSPWQCLEVRWDNAEDGEEHEQVSPWEIMPLSELPGPPPVNTTLSETERQRLHEALEEKVMVAEVAQPFMDPPDAAALAYVPLPLCLRTVVERLKNRFYRSAEQVRHDLKIVYSNACLAARPDEHHVKRARILEEALNAMLAGAELGPALAKWDGESATAAANAAALRSKPPPKGKSAAHASAGMSSGSRMIVAKVSPETTWKSSVRAAVEAFDKEYSLHAKGWCAAAPPSSPSGVQALVSTWPCCDYDALIGKATHGEYDGLNGANLLGYDLLLLCCKGFLMMPPGAGDSKNKAREALRHALGIFHGIKSSLPSASGPAAPPRSSGRRGANSDNAFKERLESLLALDENDLLRTIPPVCLVQQGSCGDEGQGARQEVKKSELNVRGLQDMVAHAESYRSSEEVGVDLLTLCAAVMLEHDDETSPVRGVAASVAAKGVLLFPKPKTISLKISLGRSAQDVKSGSSSRPARRHADPVQAGSAEEGSQRKGVTSGEASGDSDRATRAALRQSQSEERMTGGNSGESSSTFRRAEAGSSARNSPSEGSMSGAGACAIECPGVRDWLKKCMGKLRDADKLGIFEDAVTDDIAPGYSKVICHPMCLADMQQALDGGGYDHLPQVFLADLMLIVANALIYNQPGDVVSDAALTLAKRGLNLFADKIPEWNALLESSSSAGGVRGACRSTCRESPFAAQLERLETLQGLDSSKLFEKPVSNEDVPGYSTVIKVAMDLSTMQEATHRYGDDRLMRLDATLIGVNCCIFNGAETPYYNLAIKFLKGVLRAWKPRSGAGAAGVGMGGARKCPAGVASSGKAQGYRTPERAQESDSSLYFQEDDPAAGSTRHRQQSHVGRGNMRASRRQQAEDEDAENGDEEFVPTKRRSAAKSSKKRARRDKDTGSDNDGSDESDASWGKGGSGDSENSEEDARPRAASSTRAERAVARRAGGRVADRKAGDRRTGRKRKRLAVSSGSEEEQSSEASFEDDDSE